MKVRNITYLIAAILTLVFLTTGVCGQHLQTGQDVNELSSKTNKKEEKRSLIKSSSQEALVQVQKVVVDKSTYLFRKIGAPIEFSQISRFENNLIIPKILQTLFLSAISRNAP